MEYNSIFVVDRIISIDEDLEEKFNENKFIKTILNFDYKLVNSKVLSLKNKVFIEIEIKGIITYLLFDDEVNNFIFDIYMTPKISDIDAYKLNKEAFLVDILAIKLVFISGNKFNLHGEILVKYNKRL